MPPAPLVLETSDVCWTRTLHLEERIAVWPSMQVEVLFLRQHVQRFLAASGRRCISRWIQLASHRTGFGVDVYRHLWRKLVCVRACVRFCGVSVYLLRRLFVLWALKFFLDWAPTSREIGSSFFFFYFPPSNTFSCSCASPSFCGPYGQRRIVYESLYTHLVKLLTRFLARVTHPLCISVCVCVALPLLIPRFMCTSRVGRTFWRQEKKAPTYIWKDVMPFMV